jgi:hypothetical protein
MASNDGTTAWWGFLSPSVSSSVTYMDNELMKSFATILGAMSSGYETNMALHAGYRPEDASIWVRYG